MPTASGEKPRHWRSATPEDVEPLAQLLEREKIAVIRPALYL